MTRSQIIITIVALIVVILIFRLPKVIINEDEKQLSEQKNDQGRDHPAPELSARGNKKLSDEVLEKINNLRIKFYYATDVKKKVTFAESLGNTFYSFNWLDSAAKYYENVLELNPDNLDIKAKLAMTYITTETPMKGVMLLREVISVNPNHQEALYNLGTLSIQSGQYKKAVDRFEKLTKINPENADAQFYLGVSYMELGEKQKAISAFHNVKQLKVDSIINTIVDNYLSELQ
ncbi:MAG: tetratricopeptide repeat protein [Cytophagales bacterium]|nr:tetratricopeptide repeat protein [Cytophagales bacterium]